MKLTIFMAIVILFPYAVLIVMSALSLCRAAKRGDEAMKRVEVELTEGL